MGYYIDQSSAQALKDYQYSGTDLSLTYKYILSPWAQFCVDHFTSRIIAPNTITSLGLLAMLTSYLIMCFYASPIDASLSYSPDSSPNETEDIPRWVYFLNGFAMVFYQTLDNMDGKQARRTSTSSPLGMLFDHGCDAINSPLGSINWSVSMAISPLLHPCILFLTLCTSAVPFYVATWEEYYTGTLTLPIINGPSEGLLIGAGVSFVSAAFGPQWWHSTSLIERAIDLSVTYHVIEKLPFLANLGEVFTTNICEINTLQNLHFIMTAAAVCALQEIILKTTYVVRLHGLKSLLNLLPFITLILCSVLSIIGHPELIVENTRMCMCVFGVVFVEITCAVMMDHMTKKDYQPFHRYVLYPLIIFAVIANLPIDILPSHLTMTNERAEIYLYSYFCAAMTYVIFKVTVQVSEITEVLGIWCFDIVTPREEGSIFYSAKEKKS